MHHIAKNLPETFTDNKGVTKSSYPTYNAPERMEVPIKTIQLSLPKKRGRSTAAPKDNAPSKRLRISRTISSKSVNPNLPQVGRHPKWMSIQNPDQNPPGSTVHPNSDPEILEHPDSIWEMTRSPKGLTFSHAILISRTESII